MKDKVFIDTNIWVYAKIPHSDTVKHKIAFSLLKNNSNKIIISTQVIIEFYNVLRKNGIDDSDIQTSINQLIPDTDLQLITINTINLSWEIRAKYQYSIFDSLIIAAALESGCSELISEDMQHNQHINEKLKILNPFKL